MKIINNFGSQHYVLFLKNSILLLSRKMAIKVNNLHIFILKVKTPYNVYLLMSETMEYKFNHCKEYCSSSFSLTCTLIKGSVYPYIFLKI